MRWVWPTIIASTVVSCERVGDVRGSDRPRGVPTRLPIVFSPVFVPWWMTTTWTCTPSCAEALRLGLDPRRLVEELEAGRRAGGDELRRVLQLGADDADLDAVDREHLGGRDPRRAPCRSPSRRCSSPGTGSSPAPGASAAARRRSRTRGCRTTWRRGPTRSRRRSPACPRAGRSSAARRRRCRRRPAGGPAPAAPRSPRRTSSRGTRRHRRSARCRRTAWSPASSARAGRGSR